MHPGDSTVVTSAFGKADACTSYHALLRSNPALAESTHKALVRAHIEHRIMIQDRLLCNVLRPRFIDAPESRVLSRAAETVAALLERAGAMLLSSDRQMDRVNASEAEREIWSIDPGFTGITVTSRLDSFMRDGSLRFIEYNAESPASIGYCDVLTQIFEDLPAMREWQVPCPPQRKDGRASLLGVLLRAFQEWGGTGRPCIAVVDWDDVITRRDFELCVDHFQSQGIVAIVCDPRSLEYRNGKVWHNEQRIDLVYRRVLLNELLDKAAEARALLQAYRDGAVCMVNCPRSKLLHKKTLFAYLSDDSLGLDLSDEERQVVEHTVPWTRCLVEGTTTWHGEQVDLVRLLTSRQDEFVLKPVDDYGGRGIVLGWETPEDEWQSELESRSGSGYIVQERVDVPTEDFPVWRSDHLEEANLILDTNPLLFDGKMGCILTRMSGSALLNVTAGTGTTSPTFVLAQED